MSSTGLEKGTSKGLPPTKGGSKGDGIGKTFQQTYHGKWGGTREGEAGCKGPKPMANPKH